LKKRERKNVKRRKNDKEKERKRNKRKKKGKGRKEKNCLDLLPEENFPSYAAAKNYALIRNKASASGGLRLPDLLPELCPWTHWGTSVPRPSHFTPP